METTDTLVMQSTTDTPEQIREGLGLPPAEPVEAVEPEAAAEAAEAAIVAEQVVDEEPVAEVVAPAVAKPAAVVKPAVVAGKKPAATQKELDRVAAAARRDAAARNVVLEAEIKALRERLDQSIAPVQPPKAGEAPAIDPDIRADFAQRRQTLGAKPKQEDFENFGDFEDKRDEWLMEMGALRTEERLAHQGAARRTSLAVADANRTWQTTLENFNTKIATVRAKYADYDEVATKADAAKLTVSAAVRQEVLLAEDDCGELQYHLMKHPDVLARLNALPPARVGMELGKLAATLTAPRRPTLPFKRTSNAPEPTGTELGSLSSARTDDLEQVTSQAEYNRIRAKQRQSRGLGR